MDKAAAHEGLDALPSVTNPQKACGECHEEIVATAKNSLHATLSTFPKVLANRANKDKWEQIDKARKNHCSACHTSCGGCHVSRPTFAGKGFVKGHVFQKRTDSINQCTACHGSRVGSEFYGERGRGTSMRQSPPWTASPAIGPRKCMPLRPRTSRVDTT